MYELTGLVKRNLKIYFRDKLSVFFSLLSSLILIIIYVLFLANSVGGNLNQIISANETKFLVYSNMLAGMLVLNTLTIPLGVLGSVVTDIHTKKMDAFLVTPVKRYKIILGYYLSSYLITLALSIIIWLGAVVFMGLTLGIFYDFRAILLVIALLPLFIFISTSFMILLTTFIPSVNAFGAISGIFGSVIGFLSGIYIPLSSGTPEMLRNISSLVPFTHMGIIYKNILMNQSFNLLADKTNNNQEILENVKDSFGANELGIFLNQVPMIVIMIGAVLIAVLLIALATRRLNKQLSK